MFKSSTIRWLTVIFILIAISPSLVFAQLNDSIVPCTGALGNEPCKFCHIAQLAQNILNAGIYIAVFLSAALFVYAGVIYISAGGDPSKASQAKSIFWHVGAGLVLILAAWLIVDLIMKVLVGDSLNAGGAGFGPWNQIC